VAESLADWKERAPALAAECAERWSLIQGEPYEYAFVSVAVRAELPDGTPAVLKVGWPHLESEHEAEALAHYAGGGAVQLLAHDPARNALLLERCEPGTPLREVADEEEALAIAAGILRRLWRPPGPGHPFRDVAADAATWLSELPEHWERFDRPFERELLDEALAALVELPATQGELVLCHQDFHGGNVLAAEREPWLAIDPKPVVAEREFDTAAVIREGGGAAVRRLDFLAAELDLDRERMRRWALAHTLAWGFFESGAITDHVEVARLLLAAG
jgi:streptomycin 6-kinase